MIELPENVIAGIISLLDYRDIESLFCTHRRFDAVFKKYLINDYIFEWESHVPINHIIGRHDNVAIRLLKKFNRHIVVSIEQIDHQSLIRIFDAMNTHDFKFALYARHAFGDLSDLLIEKLNQQTSDRILEIFKIVVKYHSSNYSSYCGVNLCYYRLANSAAEHDNLELVKAMRSHGIVFDSLSQVCNTYVFRTAIVHNSCRVHSFLQAHYTDLKSEFAGHCYRNHIKTALRKLIQTDPLERSLSCSAALNFIGRSNRESYEAIRMLIVTGELDSDVIIHNIFNITDVSLRCVIMALQLYDYDASSCIKHFYKLGRLDIIEYITATYDISDDLLNELIGGNIIDMPT